MDGTAPGDYDESVPKKKKKKPKLTFRIRKSSELNNMDLKVPTVDRKSSLNQKRNSMFTHMNDE